MEYSYYLTQRPAGPGCQPRKGLLDIEDLDNRFVPEIGRTAWSKVTYDRPLTDEEIRNYELIRKEERPMEKTIGRVTVTEILFTLDFDPTIQKGLLVHDENDTFRDGDAVYPWEDIDTEDDLDQMLTDSVGITSFIVENGIYRCQ